MQVAHAGEQNMRAVLDDHGLDVDYAVVRDALTLLDATGTHHVDSPLQKHRNKYVSFCRDLRVKTAAR